MTNARCSPICCTWYTATRWPRTSCTRFLPGTLLLHRKRDLSAYPLTTTTCDLTSTTATTTTVSVVRNSPAASVDHRRPASIPVRCRSPWRPTGGSCKLVWCHRDHGPHTTTSTAGQCPTAKATTETAQEHAGPTSAPAASRRSTTTWIVRHWGVRSTAAGTSVCRTRTVTSGTMTPQRTCHLDAWQSNTATTQPSRWALPGTVMMRMTDKRGPTTDERRRRWTSDVAWPAPVYVITHRPTLRPGRTQQQRHTSSTSTPKSVRTRPPSRVHSLEATHCLPWRRRVLRRRSTSQVSSARLPRQARHCRPDRSLTN